ncbi:MAG: hypothetical protein GXN91_02970 [Epsilonproteobacteria bacterium]|nr:hypothetical protein [Campylobacterota bacterium]
MKIDLEKDFPNIYSKVDKDDFIDELRYFVVVDENYEDFDDEENDVFDPAEYNYLVYITQRAVDALGKENLEALYNSLDKDSSFENFLVAEEDLYGVKSELNEEEIGLKVMRLIDKLIEERG